MFRLSAPRLRHFKGLFDKLLAILSPKVILFIYLILNVRMQIGQIKHQTGPSVEMSLQST